MKPIHKILLLSSVILAFGAGMFWGESQLPEESPPSLSTDSNPDEQEEDSTHTAPDSQTSELEEDSAPDSQSSELEEDSTHTAPDIQSPEIVGESVEIPPDTAETSRESEESQEQTPTENQDFPPGDFGDFSSTTMDGDPISYRIFADYELTMVNIWATWCGPCVDEMGYLAELYEKLPEEWNLITVCSDATTNTEMARAILSANNAHFHTVMDNTSVNNTILARCTAFPTTVFVDSKGNVVYGLVGAPPSNVVEAYWSIFQSLSA